MKLTYEGPLSGVSVGGLTVKRGETVDVPDETGKALLAQNPKSWSSAKKPKAKPEE